MKAALALTTLLIFLSYQTALGEHVDGDSGQGMGENRPAGDPEFSQDADAKRVPLGKNVTFEVSKDGKRRVIVPAVVSLRSGPLELFLCRRFSKEHESVVAADIDAKDLHAALLASGAIPGAPVKFEPKFEAPSGTKVNILVRYFENGKEKTVNAKDWVRETQSKKSLSKDWVFAGSFLYDIPGDEDANAPKGKKRKTEKRYAANEGNVVTVSNFPDSMMDLPMASSAANADLQFEAFSERIPAVGTKVQLIFEVISEQPANSARP